MLPMDSELRPPSPWCTRHSTPEYIYFSREKGKRSPFQPLGQPKRYSDLMNGLFRLVELGKSLKVRTTCTVFKRLIKRFRFE